MGPLEDTFLKEFTSSPEFKAKLKETLDYIKKTIEWQCKVYSDSFQIVGMVGLSVHNVRKANRIFASLVRGKVGEDKPEHEIDDLLMYAVYTRVYYQMLKDQEQERIHNLPFGRK